MYEVVDYSLCMYSNTCFIFSAGSLGSTSHSITQERKKVAWFSVSPSTVDLLPDDEEEGDHLVWWWLPEKGFKEDGR